MSSGSALRKCCRKEAAGNLDGGQTAVMAFMGEKLNEVDKDVPNGRETNEILTFGLSDQVGSTP